VSLKNNDLIVDDVTEENFVCYAMKAYENPQILSMAEFQEDLKKVKYIKRLFIKYELSGELKERLILNHITILSNMFTVIHATRLLFFGVDKKHWSYLKTFLMYLYMMPDVVIGINGKDIISSDIPVNMSIVKVLRSL